MKSLLYTIKCKADTILWGLSSVWAVCGIILFELASFGFLICFILHALGKTESDGSFLPYTVLAFHYCLLMTFFFVHNIVICLSRVDLDDEYGFDKDSGVGGEDKASDTSNYNEDEETTIAIHGPGGAEIVLKDAQDYTHFSVVPVADQDALPMRSSGIQAIVRVASVRRLQPPTRIRTSRLRSLESQGSHLSCSWSASSYSSSSSSTSTSSFDDDSTYDSRWRY